MELEVETLACPFCGDAGEPWGDDEGWKLRQCRLCRLVSLSPRPTSQEIEALYALTMREEPSFAGLYRQALSWRLAASIPSMRSRSFDPRTEGCTE
jgi:hypothetical protein